MTTPLNTEWSLFREHLVFFFSFLLKHKMWKKAALFCRIEVWMNLMRITPYLFSFTIFEVVFGWKGASSLDPNVLHAENPLVDPFILDSVDKFWRKTLQIFPYRCLSSLEFNKKFKNCSVFKVNILPFNFYNLTMYLSVLWIGLPQKICKTTICWYPWHNGYPLFDNQEVSRVEHLEARLEKLVQEVGAVFPPLYYKEIVSYWNTWNILTAREKLFFSLVVWVFEVWYIYQDCCGTEGRWGVSWGNLDEMERGLLRWGSVYTGSKCGIAASAMVSGSFTTLDRSLLVSPVQSEHSPDNDCFLFRTHKILSRHEAGPALRHSIFSTSQHCCRVAASGPPLPSSAF